MQDEITITKEYVIKNFGEIVVKTLGVRGQESEAPRALGLIFEPFGIEFLKQFGLPVHYVSELPSNWYNHIDAIVKSNIDNPFDVKLSVELKHVTISHGEYNEYCAEQERGKETFLAVFFPCDKDGYNFKTINGVDGLIKFMQSRNNHFMFNSIYRFSEIKPYIYDSIFKNKAGNPINKYFKLDTVEKFALRPTNSVQFSEIVI